jgi:hypothetical protein
MRLPELDNPDRYAGLYVYDFGEWSAVGYTAAEIAVLLESNEYGGGKAYRILRAWPDGRMELAGVSPRRFQLESGMFFLRNDEAPAREDFERLTALGEDRPPPCRATVHVARRRGGGETRNAAAGPEFVTCLIYPAEFESDMGAWLLSVDFAGGDRCEGGISHVADYQQEAVDIIEQKQLWPRNHHTSRSAEQVLANVRTAVQR